MEKHVNEKQALKRAWEADAIIFVGLGSRELNGRCCRWVITRISGLLRSDRLGAGVKAGAALLGGMSYSERQVLRGLAALTAAGLVRRDRDPAGRRGNTREAPATNYISATIFEEAIRWAVSWQKSSRRPADRVIQVPTTFQPYRSAKPAPARVSAGQHDNLSLQQHDKLSEGLRHTPPL